MKHSSIFATADDWAIGSDGIQWMLYRRKHGPSRGPEWYPVSFVRSSRDIIARCMREKGVSEAFIRILLAGLPDTFDDWESLQRAIQAPLVLDEPLVEAPSVDSPI
jgi:hypothetical protein